MGNDDIGKSIQELRQLQHDAAQSFNLVHLFMELIEARERGVDHEQVIAAIQATDSSSPR